MPQTRQTACNFGAPTARTEICAFDDIDLLILMLLPRVVMVRSKDLVYSAISFAVKKCTVCSFVIVRFLSQLDAVITLLFATVDYCSEQFRAVYF